ncbi:MAG: response regulator [Magnetococcales bacterium]|nr:response regulator [Magnetococcales bacterium]MBF0148563.1 response regulator [Magnetococcales bacterium]MBF0173788.1 response regulator [Magnetococcales bacterium]MBF0348861.1 response regulator [Magnetococcales bacterium]MBF0629744.1 response regulator [Magnetococcales bacterium]
MRVLIVDDSSVMRKIVSRGLRQAGFKVDDILEAGDGQEAMGILTADSNFQLILSDWNMPVMDGLNFVKSVRGSGGPAKSIPIVMVTTEGGESKVQAAIEAGANGHIKKPFTPDTLKATLGQFMK